MKKNTRRLFAVLLSLVLMIGVIAIPAAADYKKPYKVYSSFGDSIAAGLGLPDYQTSANPTGTLGDGDRIPGSYPDIVADAVGIPSEDTENFYAMSRQGYRSNELRMILDDTYMGDTITFAMLPQLSLKYKDCYDENGQIIPAKLIAKVKAQKTEYNEAIDRAELITLQIGSNDLMESLMVQLFAMAWGGTTDIFSANSSLQQLLNRFGSIGKVYEYLAKELTGYKQSDTTLGALLTKILDSEQVAELLGTGDQLAGVLNTILTAEDGYKENLEWIANYIHERNPDAKVLLVGLYNPLRDSQISEDLPLKVGHIADVTMAHMNAIQMGVAKKYDNFSYVSAWDAEVVQTLHLYEIDVKDPTFFHKVSAYIHPNEAGHAYIADQILNALPDVWEGKLVRRNPVDKQWYYYDGDKIDTSYTGLAKNQYGWWYVQKGKVTFRYNGFATNQYGTWRVVHSKVDFGANGLTGEQRDWRYVKGGKVDPSVTGVCQNQFGWWYVKNGILDFSFRGIAKNKYGTWFLENGAVNFSKFGRVSVGGRTYRVFGGRVL